MTPQQYISPKAPEVQEIVGDCYKSLEVTAKVFFPGRFRRDFTDRHRDMFEVLQDKSNRKIVIAAPRGFGKTSINNLLLPAYHIMFNEAKYIVPISYNEAQAMQQSENLKRKLVENDMIRKTFGPIKSDTFSKQQWITNNGICVMPRGAGQQVRGLLYDDYRPDLIIVDDLENPKELDSDTVREAKKEWFDTDVSYAIDLYDPNPTWRIIVIGTVLAENSLVQDLLDDPEWTSLRIELFDDDYKSCVPEWVSDEQIRGIVENARKKGKLDQVYRELRNLPVAKEDASFQERDFRYYNLAPEQLEGVADDQKHRYSTMKDSDLQRDKKTQTIVIVDPARTAKIHSSESAIIAIGVNLWEQRFYVRDIVHGKFHRDELFDHIFEVMKRLKSRVLGVETTGLHEHITQPLRNEMIRRCMPAELIELTARGGQHDDGKLARIGSMASYYRRGEVWHNKQVSDPLEAQLLAFPRSKLKDIMDALGYLPQMLEKGGRYFVPKGKKGMEDRDVVEAEYAELMTNAYEDDVVVNILDDPF